MTAITIIVLYNTNFMAMSDGHKDGDILEQVGTFVVMKDKPTVSYVNADLLQEVFIMLNSEKVLTPRRSMSRGDVLKIEYMVGSSISTSHYAIDSSDWKLLG